MALKNELARSGLRKEEQPEVRLLEFDRRFDVFKGEFVFYDFNEPWKLPREFSLVLLNFAGFLFWLGSWKGSRKGREKTSEEC